MVRSNSAIYKKTSFNVFELSYRPSCVTTLFVDIDLRCFEKSRDLTRSMSPVPFKLLWSYLLSFANPADYQYCSNYSNFNRCLLPTLPPKLGEHGSFWKRVIAFFSKSLDLISLYNKWSFPLKISSVNVRKSAISYSFGHIYWRNL